jgi:hypothetical protein
MARSRRQARRRFVISRIRTTIADGIDELAQIFSKMSIAVRPFAEPIEHDGEVLRPSQILADAMEVENPEESNLPPVKSPPFKIPKPVRSWRPPTVISQFPPLTQSMTNFPV